MADCDVCMYFVHKYIDLISLSDIFSSVYTHTLYHAILKYIMAHAILNDYPEEKFCCKIICEELNEGEVL